MARIVGGNGERGVKQERAKTCQEKRELDKAEMKGEEIKEEKGERERARKREKDRESVEPSRDVVAGR